MRRTILTITTILIISTSIGCNTTSDQNDLGIVEGKLDTYFLHDTTYAPERITIIPKIHLDSLELRPYYIGIQYNQEYDETEPSWKLNFFISHSEKYISVYPRKGILNIDDFELIYDDVRAVESKYDSTTTFYYNRLDTSLISNKIPASDMINKIAAAKRVSFTALGIGKKEYILSPKIIEDASKTLEYFDIIKTTKPSFY